MSVQVCDAELKIYISSEVWYKVGEKICIVTKETDMCMFQGLKEQESQYS